MRVTVTHDLDDLERDLKRIPVMVARDMREVVNDGAKAGNELAKQFARRSAGAHGKHYWRAFTWDRASGSLFGGASFSAEYGPLPGRKQGGMSFEFGSRNQPPHLDLARSADIIGPQFPIEVRAKMDGWFWP